MPGGIGAAGRHGRSPGPPHGAFVHTEANWPMLNPVGHSSTFNGHTCSPHNGAYVFSYKYVTLKPFGTQYGNMGNDIVLDGHSAITITFDVLVGLV